MFLSVIFWIIIILIVFWALIDPISRVCNALGEVFWPIFNFRTIDLKAKFGEWAGMKEIKINF